jgi:hypothetical protein
MPTMTVAQQPAAALPLGINTATTKTATVTATTFFGSLLKRKSSD